MSVGERIDRVCEEGRVNGVTSLIQLSRYGIFGLRGAMSALIRGRCEEGGSLTHSLMGVTLNVPGHNDDNNDGGSSKKKDIGSPGVLSGVESQKTFS